MTDRFMSGPFRALSDRNYRLYFLGQTVSGTGSWMQRIAQAWLVLDLTRSPVSLGVVTTLQYLPILVLSVGAGVYIDRLPKRRLLVVVQAAALLQAAALGILALLGVVELWHVYVLAFLLGCVNAFDNTARNSLIGELVEPERLASAVSLNSSVQNLARIAGPVLGGIVIAVFGVAWCFLLNAASYVAVLIALALMRIPVAAASARAQGALAEQLVDGMRAAWRVHELRVTLVMQAFVGTFGLNFIVFLPLLARDALDADSVGLGALNAAQGMGAVVGALIVASARSAGLTRLVWGCAAFGALIVVVGAAPTLTIALLVLLFMGMAQVYYTASAQTTLQLASAPEYRGRILALWTFLSAGVTPLGATFTGALADALGIRQAMAVCGLMCVFGAAMGWLAMRRAAAAAVHSPPSD